jgi:hypothetical protein
LANRCGSLNGGTNYTFRLWLDTHVLVQLTKFCDVA